MPDVIQQLDEQALVWIAEHVRCAVLDPFMELYTQLGNTGMLFIALGVLIAGVIMSLLSYGLPALFSW